MDIDVFFCGEKQQSSTHRSYSKMYNNDGQGILTEVLPAFDGISWGKIEFADIDNDNDLDVFLIGSKDENILYNFQQFSANFYRNNGNGYFSLIQNNPIEGCGYPNLDFGDIDNDDDLDFILCGSNGSGVTKTYKNDGLGGFTLFNTALDNVWGDVILGDLDGDTDLDVILSGLNAASQSVTKLYTNNGFGIFTEFFAVPFEGSTGYNCSMDLADVDNDQDLDLILTDSYTFTSLYKNLGNLNFVLTTNSFQIRRENIVKFGDLDNDQDPDLIICGTLGINQPGIADIYINDGVGNFIYSSNLPSFERPNIDLGDLDGDNDIDIILTGSTNSSMNYITHTRLFLNNGNFSFNEDTYDYGFLDLSSSAVKFCDVNNDNLLDIGLCGVGRRDCYSKIYISDRCDAYSSSISFDGISLSSNAFNATSYQWFDCANDSIEISGATSQTYVPEVNGNYSVIVNKNGCIDTSNCLIINSVGLNKELNKDLFEIYPNPNSGKFNLINHSELFGLSIKIRDISGRTIFEGTMDSIEKSIEFDAKNGIYFIAIEEKNQVVYLKKLVVNH